MAGLPHLPGVTLNLNDLGLKIAPPPAGPKVTLLGITSNTDVPKLEPLTVTNVGKVTSALWLSGAGGHTVRWPSELAIAVEEAAAAGAPHIEIMVIEHAGSTNLQETEGVGSEHPNEVFSSPTHRHGINTRYWALSGAYETLKQGDLTIVHPVNAWADATGLGSKNFGKQLADFCHQASKDVDNAVIGVLPLMNPVEWALCYKDDLTAAGVSWQAELDSIVGIDDTTFGIPSIALVNEWVEYVTQHPDNHAPPATINSTAENFPASFANYLAGSEDTSSNFFPLDDENSATDVNPAYFTAGEAGWQATNTDNTAATDQKGNKVDAGRRISIFAAPLVTKTSGIKKLAANLGASLANSIHNTNGAAAYAGKICSLAPQSAPTNKPIVNIKPSRPLSPAQANRITARRITTMHNRATGFVVSSAVTGAHHVSRYVRSDFVRLTTIRIVDAVVDIVRAVSDKYIGEPNTASARNALSNEIEKFLKQMRVANALNGWKMFISATPDQQVLGEATIDLTLVPAFELVKIEANISLAKQI